MKFFTKKSVGLDIADHTIEVAELTKRGKKLEISSLGRVLLEPGIVERGRIKNEEKLTKAVKEVFLKAKPHPIVTSKVIFGLPESQVYVHIFELGPHNKKDRDELVLNELQKNIPLKKDDLLFSYKGNVAVAASKEVVREWWEFFHKLKLTVEVFDIESLATFRSIFTDKTPEGPICLLDIGAVTTNVAIFDEKGLRYSHSINVAGEVFTEEIAKALGIKPEEAEKQKREVGLADKNSRIFPVLIKALEPVSEEIKTLLNYFEGKNRQKVHPHTKRGQGAEGAKIGEASPRSGVGVKEILLVGGSAKLKGIVDYFNTNLGLPAYLMGGPEVPLEYAEAVGLALRGLNKKWLEKDPAIQIKDLRLKVKEKKVEERPKEEGLKSEILNLESREAKKKLRSQKVLLIAILIIGIAVIGVVYWFRSQEKAQKEEELKSRALQYTKTQSFDLKIPVAVYTEEYTLDRVRGRIIENTQIAAGHYEEAVAHSRIEVEKKLAEGERLWLTPLEVIDKNGNKIAELGKLLTGLTPISPEQTIFPMTIKWVVYSEADANKVFLKEVDKLNKDKIEYALNNIEKNNLESTNNPYVFYLVGKVTISLNQLIEQ